MSNFNQVNRRSFLKASSVGAAVAVTDITLPFNVMAADAPKTVQESGEKVVWSACTGYLQS